MPFQEAGLGLSVLSKLVIGPAKTIKVGGITRLGLHGSLNQLDGFSPKLMRKRLIARIDSTSSRRPRSLI